MTEDYLYKLKKEMRAREYHEDYINLCIQYAERLISNNLPVIFDFEQLSLMTGNEKKFIHNVIFNKDSFYTPFPLMNKKNNKVRYITAPSRKLRKLQSWILHNILENIQVSESAKGFIKGKSILENAQEHLNNEYVISLDIKDFFPSISSKIIYKIFRYYGYTKQVASILTNICTYNDVLPQGAPTSPYLANIVCIRLDKRLSSLAIKLKGNYTRYADDMTFSGGVAFCENLDLAYKIIEEEGFMVNNDKTTIQTRSGRQSVTGIVVNNNVVRVPREIKRTLRQHIFFCKKFGVEYHLQQRKGNTKYVNFKEYLFGMAYYIKMIEEETGLKFIKQLSEIDWPY